MAAPATRGRTRTREQGRATRRARREDGFGGIARALVSALMLAAVGFGIGLVLGVVSGEPQLLLGHLRGRSAEVPWREAPATAIAQAPAPAERAPAPAPEAPLPAVSAPARPAPVPEPAREAAPEPARRPEPAPRAPVAKPAPAVPQAAPAARPAGPIAPGFAVQVGAFTSRSAANELRERLAASGYEAYLTPARGMVDGKVRVRVGPVPDRADAQALALRLERGEKLPTWVLAEAGGNTGSR